MPTRLFSAISCSADATPPRVGSFIATMRARRAVERRANQSVDRRDVGPQIAVERQPVAPRHHRHPVIADRAGHDQHVAGAQARVAARPDRSWPRRSC